MHLTGLSDTVGPSAGAAETSVTLELGPRWGPARLQRGGRGAGRGRRPGTRTAFPRTSTPAQEWPPPGVAQSGTRSALGEQARSPEAQVTLASWPQLRPALPRYFLTQPRRFSHAGGADKATTTQGRAVALPRNLLALGSCTFVTGLVTAPPLLV